MEENEMREVSAPGDMGGMNETAAFPRPQFRRAHWIDLCGPWDFAYDDANVGLGDRWPERPDVFDRTITVPFPPESTASGIGDRTFHRVVWYRRETELTPPPDRQVVLLHCGAIDYRADLWVNGRHIITHVGGHVPFVADITHALRPDGKQVIVIRAEDDPLDVAQPRGKQDWKETPHRIWYDRTTGIWQPLWIEIVGEAYVTSLRWTPDFDRGLVAVSLALTRSHQRPLAVDVRLSKDGVVLAQDRYTIRAALLTREIALDEAAISYFDQRRELLWSPEYPNLIDALITVSDGETVLDQVESYLGLRSAGISEGRFLLNGDPYFLRLVLEQGFWPQSHLAAPSGDALRREVELIKELGFNGVRIHQKVEDPRFLYWCDRLGLLVWGEMANSYEFSARAMTALLKEWTEVVEHRFNHPSIVTWVPLNESWGVPHLARSPAEQHFVQTVYHLTRALDPTRPVIANDGWEHLVGDIVGIHDYALEGRTIRERYGTPEALERTLREVQPLHRSVLLNGMRRTDQPVMLTEFGGISYRPDHTAAWFGYGTVATREDFLAKYRELVEAILQCPTIAGFCYTQLTDTQQETNGLLTEDRVPKLDPAAVRAITMRPSAAVPGDVIRSIQNSRGVSPFDGAEI